MSSLYMNYSLLITILAILFAAWFAWRYVRLRRAVDEFAGRARTGDTAAKAGELEGLASAISSLVSTFNLKQSALDAERARLATVLEQMTDGVLIADEAGLVQFANPAAGRLFQTSEPLKRSVAEVVRNHQLVEAWRRCQQTRRMQSETVEVPTRHQYLQLVVIPDRHSSGSLLLVQDLTRIRRLETVRRDFISNLSHELRTPLASLKALTETLQDGALDDPPAARRFIDQIQVETDALTQMVTELLELSRIESGRLSLDLRPAAPCDLLDSACKRMQLQAERAGLSLRVECSADLPQVRIDAQRLEQVLVNFIHNAVKFTRPGGEVVLFSEAGADEVRFAVRDTGIGIPADDVPRIFERFYRVDKSRAGSGTGLGLSIAKHIVEAHNGRIWAESIEGQGSTFYFTIPINLILERPEALAQGFVCIPDDHEGTRVHLVDDRLQTRDFGACYDTVQNRAVCARIGACPFKDGDAANQLVEDACRNGFGLAGDDHRRADGAAALQRGLGDQPAHVQGDHGVERLPSSRRRIPRRG
jgi:two-component system, OmpR family, phosphate regulon sensor histidine kinase PhoR